MNVLGLISWYSYQFNKLDWTVLMRKGQFECYFFRKFTINIVRSIFSNTFRNVKNKLLNSHRLYYNEAIAPF